jgi:hypothetical protein
VDLPALSVVVPCLLAVVVGGMAQGALGFGLALVAVPVLAWLAPSTVPVGILVTVLPLVLVAALRERAHADVRGLAVALAYREAGGPRLRATLSAFFLVGSVLSLGMLAVAGEVTADGLAAGAALVPAVGVGYALAEPLRHRLRRRGVREAVLAFSTLAATGLAAQALLA